MANCPKCGKHLHFYNVSQFCPECGTNMNFYGFVDNFYREAKLAELSQAKVHVMIKHIKAAYIGSKLAIARLIVCLLFGPRSPKGFRLLVCELLVSVVANFCKLLCLLEELLSSVWEELVE